MMEDRQWKSLQSMMDEFNDHLQHFFRTTAHGTLLEKMEYHLGWRDQSLQLVNRNQGKRSRSILCLLTYLLSSRSYQKVFPIATAIEIIHNFSLVFDDIQDHDPIRRGSPSVWSIWGEDEAINVGCAMQTLVQRSINQMAKYIDSDTFLEISNYIGDSMMQLCEGQQLDIEMAKSRNYIKLPQYLDMIQKKTASLFEAATYIGAVCAHTDNNNMSLSREFGKNLGIAFQLFDDAIGIWGKKKNGLDKCCSDLENRKKTYPIIFAYSRCNSTIEKNVIKQYYSFNTLTKTHISDLHKLLQEKKVLQGTLEAGQHYLDLAFEMLRQIDGDETVKQSMESWVSYFVNKQVNSLSLLEIPLDLKAASANSNLMES